MGRTGVTQVRVRYADTDADGGVYYANYLTYFSCGRNDLLREAGINLNRLMKEDGLRLLAAEATCRYRASAYFDDLLTVNTVVEHLGNSSLKFAFEIVRPENGGETLIATGSTLQVWVDADNRPATMPTWIREALS